jgi:hypothetical protein
MNVYTDKTLTDLAEVTATGQDTLKQLVKEFFYYLDMTEESDSGRVFHPTIITSCRVHDQQAINKILKQLKAHVTDDRDSTE